jgi:hypothetical protein
MRTVVAGLVALGLAIAVFLVWPRGSDDEEPETVSATTTTTTTEAVGTTSTMVTTTEDSHVVETVAEAEEILRELWFGWFEGIYNQDEDRIREVVILDETVQTARESFGAQFDEVPQPGDIEFTDIDVLRSDEECLAVWSQVRLTGFNQGDSSGVDVIRWTEEGWKRLSVWKYRGDLWEADCESSLQPSSS